MPLEKLIAFTQKVSDLADKPNATMSAAEVKAQFDAAPDEVRVYLNKMITQLQSVTDGDSGADNIKATAIARITGDTVQALLESLKALDDSNKTYLLAQIQGVVLGQVPDGSITPVKLSADTKKASTIAVEDANSRFVATNVEGALDELFTFANNGKTEVANAVTAKGVSASPGDTFTVLASKIGQINTGKKWASGTATTDASGNLIITGLNFTPKLIAAKRDGAYTNYAHLLVGVSAELITREIKVVLLSTTTAQQATITFGSSNVTANTQQASVPFHWYVSE